MYWKRNEPVPWPVQLNLFVERGTRRDNNCTSLYASLELLLHSALLLLLLLLFALTLTHTHSHFPLYLQRTAKVVFLLFTIVRALHRSFSPPIPAAVSFCLAHALFVLCFCLCPVPLFLSLSLSPASKGICKLSFERPSVRSRSCSCSLFQLSCSLFGVCRSVTWE